MFQWKEEMGYPCHLHPGYDEYRRKWRKETHRTTKSCRSFQEFSLLVLARKNTASRRLNHGIATRPGGASKQIGYAY